MRRFVKSYRTRSNVMETSQLRTQFIRELTEEAQGVLATLTQQFTDELQAQSANLLQNALSQASTGTAGDGGQSNSISSVTKLISTGVRYLVNRPKSSTNTQETSRSQSADSSFKLSRAQSLAEAGITLSKGDKNT